MGHDFAKQSYPKKKKANKRRRDIDRSKLTPQYHIGQNKLESKRHSLSSVWFVVAFGAVLLAITFIKSSLHFSTSSTHSSQDADQTHFSQKANAAIKNTATKSPQHADKSFRFYNMLRDLKLKTQNTEQLESLQDYANRFDYILQVASTRERSVADRITEQLALLGLEGHVDQVTVNDQDWWRVRLGPYHDIKQLDSVKAVLESKKINYLEFQHSNQKQ